MNEIKVFRRLPTDIIIYEILSHITVHISIRKHSIIKQYFGYYEYDDSRMIYNFFINVSVQSPRILGIPTNIKYLNTSHYIRQELLTLNKYYKKLNIIGPKYEKKIIDLSLIESVDKLNIVGKFSSIKLPKLVADVRLVSCKLSTVVWGDIKFYKNITIINGLLKLNKHFVNFSSLDKITLTECELSKIPILPKNVTYIDLSSNRIKEIDNLYLTGVTYLNLSSNIIKIIENIPETAKYIILDENPFMKINNLPQKIIKLSLLFCYRSNQHIIYNFNQHSIKHLLIKMMNIVLKNLPKDIEILQILYRTLKIDKFPKSLKTLIIDGSAKSLMQMKIKIFPKNVCIRMMEFVKSVKIKIKNKPIHSFTNEEFSKFESSTRGKYHNMGQVFQTYNKVNIYTNGRYKIHRGRRL